MNNKMNRRPSSDSEPAIPERKFCAYMHRVCQQPRIAGRKYCLRHVLEDRDSPYRQCQYVQPNTQRRCRYPAAKTERREYLCKIHVNKTKTGKAKRPMTLNETPFKVFESLEIYCQKAEHNAQMATTSRSTLKFFDPDSDQEAPLIENCYIYDGDSDAESVDEEITDFKKHAGVFTAEEAARTTKEKMVRLQQLYLEQFHRMRYMYKERRREYLYRQQFEKAHIGKDFNNPRDERLYRRFIAYKNYRQVHGQEATLKHKMKAKRKAQADGVSYPLPRTSCETCKAPGCEETLLPLTSFCPSHILSDADQKLFQPCNEDGCDEPVLRIRGRDHCPEHTSLDVDALQKLLESSLPEGVEVKEEPREFFDGMDDVAALGLDAIEPTNLFGLNQSGISTTGEADDDESTDSAMSDDGLPTDTALYDDEISLTVPGTSSCEARPQNEPCIGDQQQHQETVGRHGQQCGAATSATGLGVGPSAGPSVSKDTSNFEALKGRSVRIVGGQQLQLQMPRQMSAALQSAPEYILENHGANQT
ncbi:KAT8 regulatory NSL complex subunit 2-like [Tropilaelaps mercedesae]|uniref:KAT8 regulatory NSL complex subunit 2 n=1 Tax=Tropilaelaps mercedesae TaxID=418985 RepID=A0A1V9X6C8_9ACAR|nr:KAT8 regulatory NSL complex subunit 2-like [Tropilaelaps mercedesae]